MQKYLILYIGRKDFVSPAEDVIESFKKKDDHEARLYMRELKEKVGVFGTDFQLYRMVSF